MRNIYFVENCLFRIIKSNSIDRNLSSRKTSDMNRAEAKKLYNHQKLLAAIMKPYDINKTFATMSSIRIHPYRI